MHHDHSHVHSIEKVQFKSKSGTEASGELALPHGDGKAPGIVLIQEWWGINDNIRAALSRLSHAGFIALAPDLYHGVVTKDSEEAGRLMSQLNWPKAIDEIAGAAQHLHAHPRCIGRVGVMGFCLGGALTLAAAANVQEFMAAVPFYGIPPETLKIDYSKIKAPVLGHFATRDPWVKVAAAEAVKRQLEERGQSMELHIYEADHAFANETRPDVYNAEAAKLAWERTIEFLHKHLG